MESLDQTTDWTLHRAYVEAVHYVERNPCTRGVEAWCLRTCQMYEYVASERGPATWLIQDPAMRTLGVQSEVRWAYTFCQILNFFDLFLFKNFKNSCLLHTKSVFDVLYIHA